jgi:DNA invertase Pin-like site-specific DNA recombinase
MSEAELHVLRQRLQQGQMAKARRGELGRPVPIGYVRRSSGEVALDPDEEVRATVRLIFEQFDRIGTVGGVLKYLATQRIKLGVRAHSGPGKGEIEWRRPNRQTLQQMMHNPAYAGVYAYGRRATDPRRRRPVRATRDEIARLRADRAELGPGEWWVPDLAREVGYTVHAIYKWIARGRVGVRHLDGPLGRQVVCVTDDELARLRERSRRKPGRRKELRKPRSEAGADAPVHTV